MVLADMSGNTVELEDTLYIPNFKKKIVSLLKLLDQGYKVDEWTKTHLKISKNQRSIIIKRKQDQQMYYLIGFKVQPAAYVTNSAMDISEAHEKLGHIGEDIVRKTMQFYIIKLTGKLKPCDGCM